MSSANPNPNNPNHSSITINHPNPNASHPPPPSSASASARPSSSSSSSSQTAASACAACKYQRRKCNPDCTLAPYFRPDQQRQFLNAHRLFGVSNILKIIRNLDQRARDDAMKSIIFESNARAADPVGGCYRIIRDLERQIGHYSAELMLVARHLEMFRAQAAASAAAAAAGVALPHHYNGGSNNSTACLHPQDFAENPNVMLASAMEDYAAADDAIYGGQYTNLAAQQQQQQQQYYNYFYFDGAGIDENENNNDNQDDHHHELNSFSVNLNDNGSNNGLEIEMLSLPHSKDDDGEDDEVKPFVDIFETRQLAFPASDENEQEVVSKETTVASFHCRTKSSEQNETNNIKHGQEHDLKSAASLFTLTNCNTSIV